MFLTASNLVHYLLSRNLLDVESVVDGDFRVIEAGQRNRNFKVFFGHNQGYFIKQVKTLDTQSVATIQREIFCFELAEKYSDWSAYLPKIIESNPARHSLCLELFPAAENLTEYLDRTGNLSTRIAEKWGEALAFCHQAVDLDSIRETIQMRLPNQVPWIFSFSEAPSGATAGAQKFIEQLHLRPDHFPRLQNLAHQWRVDCLIHGDMKWENCIVYLDSKQELQLKIIDWELLDVGDARWDIGGVLQSYLVYLIKRQIQTSPNSLDPVTEILQQVSLIHSSASAFWRQYLNTSKREVTSQRAYFAQCVEFAAGRLVLTAFEWSCQLNYLSPFSAVMLALSDRIFRDPKWAVREIFGVQEGEIGEY
ncbi:phosphotransferase [Undibacterium fentianense]|uniref:Phosphotransferase n=1 Tax=Undibacterium fentianense TaxID=2828728 RepID=A0A941IEE9_9BURK|nr:phosphotransferase [Undibacterium fentianense]MBR7799561.1 phosphotransferase [Undibacterium fentianense]